MGGELTGFGAEAARDHGNRSVAQLARAYSIGEMVGDAAVEIVEKWIAAKRGNKQPSTPGAALASFCGCDGEGD